MHSKPLTEGSEEIARVQLSHAGARDSGLWSLSRLAMHLGMHVDPVLIGHDLGLGGRPATGADLVRAAVNLGFKARLLTRLPPERLEFIPRPALIRLNDERYVILGMQHGSRSDVLELDEAHPTARNNKELAAAWSGEAVLIARVLDGSAPPPTSPSAPFGASWFFPAMWRYRRPLMHVLVASLFIQLFAVVGPVFTQVIVDKVLIHNSLSTLLLVVIGLVVFGLFDVALQYLRTYALSHTACRLDLELGSRVFHHLIKQPLAFFEKTATGQITARMGEVTTIRNFLTGQGLLSLIDALFTIVLIAIMSFYSLQLTCVVLLSIAICVLIGAMLRPLVHERMKARFQRGAENQQFLVESIVGVQTLKAAAIEPLVQMRWDEELARYIKTSFDAIVLSAMTQNVMQYVSKVSTAALLYLGAKAVIEREMTIGEMIAFNMMAAQVSAPMLRLSQLWQDFQQFQVSVSQLGHIMREPTEIDSSALANLPPIEGAISFHNVSFRYRPEAPEVLSDVSLEIRAGEVVGVVGPSGSGKSTLTKLLQRLYLPQAGQITIDGVDIAGVHPAWIRQQIGVVLQENLLFNRTIHENIALAEPYMTREEVVALARLAGADEFIRQLPQGYDTRVVERGMNLSGGQRQRIALARSLARKPRILIMDEATSAIDYESERSIQRNLKQIVRGRTVIIIAHRLSAVRTCDRIVGIVNGRIVEEGTHESLLRREGGLYCHLWSVQNELNSGVN